MNGVARKCQRSGVFFPFKYKKSDVTGGNKTAKVDVNVYNVEVRIKPCSIVFGIGVKL